MKNQQLTTVIAELKRLAIERKRPLWKRVATDLEKPTRQRRVVNLWRVDQVAKEGELIVVPGKLLGEGELTKKVTIAAAQYSESARAKLAANGSTLMSLTELTKKVPDGKNVRIIG
ncbi:50S ribosomal protein L18e [Candidatus Woesearchaeota archaeon]|nr:MAG: 50S ribosomal protein L18e [Candidatus Woesearchaeota archaeon]